MLTNEKKSFYKFKNKVDLTNRQTFGYFSTEDPLNNELFVYLNTSLDGSSSESITNRNIGYDINNAVKLFWDNRLNEQDVKTFYDESLFENGQPELTEYMQYKGNIFELYERLTQYTKAKIDIEQQVKSKYLEWFDEKFLSVVGLERLSKYIFNLTTFANNEVNAIRNVSPSNLSVDFNEYFKISSDTDITDDMYVLANSNSIRPSRVYYKKIGTKISDTSYENKFLFPLYITNDISTLNSITGLTLLHNIGAVNDITVKKSNNYQ